MRRRMTVDWRSSGPARPAWRRRCSPPSSASTTVLHRRAGRSPAARSIARIERAGERRSPLGPEYLAGRKLAARVARQRRAIPPGTTVWHIDPGRWRAVSWHATAAATRVTARRILLATGAIERPVPMPGWTLPGVMTVGAAQILLKTAGLVPEGRAVLAGQGPLLYLAALQLARAGAPPLAVLETTPRENYAAAARHLGGCGRAGAISPRVWDARRAAPRRHHGARAACAGCARSGARRIERVAWDGGEIAADHLLLHEGVIPNMQISLALAVARTNGTRRSCAGGRWSTNGAAPACRTSRSPAMAAGSPGPRRRRLSGRLAALDAAHAPRPDRRGRARPPRRADPRERCARERAMRPFLDALYRPAD